MPQRNPLLRFQQPGEPLHDAWRLPLDAISPDPQQPRQQLGDLAELQADILQHGQITPITVRPAGAGRYQIIAGERRWAAMQAAGLTHIAAVIVEADDATARALSIRENVQRLDLEPEELGRYFQSLHDAGASLRDIAAAIGKSHMYVSRYIRLAQDPTALEEYQAGQANLEEIGRGPVTSPTPEPAPEPAERNKLLQPAPAPRTFHRQATIYKPFYMLRNHVQRLDVTQVATAEREDLRQTARAVIAELEALIAELDQE